MSLPLLVAFLIGSYLLGAVPFGLVIGRARGKDIRQLGSGNIGATNVARSVGMGWGILCLLLDALKGALPPLILRLLSSPDWAVGAALLAPVLGHLFSPYLRLRGGKGVATVLGATLPICPLCAGLGVLAYLLVYVVGRVSAPGSLALVATTGISLWLVVGQPAVTAAHGVAAALILLKHLPNLRRLARGEENRL